MTFYLSFLWVLARGTDYCSTLYVCRQRLSKNFFSMASWSDAADRWRKYVLKKSFLVDLLIPMPENEY